CAKKEDSFDVW
nr:immunoglobulin heavy chain junction region [Macaca mulatta]MOV37794.1 immunoglobulin heavy chain junction region [Macaca mulatta]MOV37846.1 immunoglobulin heavy chain junction region [Macaca mulatta]MOV37910.1 immunoglobulin heavy chain junction region [Macaca mulatta]MOV37973.1 immunoglobulin heavy chain junction region [Macaca mulatta]